MSSSPLIVPLLCLPLALFLWLRKPKASPASLPPGPKPVPFLGNIRDLTTKELWLPASEWARQYGDVVYVNVLGQGLVFLNSPEAASDLLDKRGSIYSDKPSLIMTGELCGCKNMVAFTSYGEQFKRQRRLLHKAFGLPVIPSYYPLLESSTLAFLRRVLASPSSYTKHIREYAGGLTLSVVYGYEPVSEDDPFLSMAEECVRLLSERIASGGGIWPVDIFPSLQYLPDWMPGAGFKRNAKVWKKKIEEFVHVPFEFVKTSMKIGTYKPSFCSTLMEEVSDCSGLNSEFEFDLKWTANSMYAASIDTTVTTVSHFILAMMLHPDAQAKAQAEIDAVIGRHRLPTFSDRSSLPYVEAVLKETLRWAVPVPLNLPHMLTENDVYKGMFIPKGSLVFGNIWAMQRDPSVYPEPESFVPERFLEATGGEGSKNRDSRDYVFGFGRRKCPGINLMDSSTWMLIVSMLATLDISKAVDEHGKVIEPQIRFENPIFRTPTQFQCDMRPRSAKALNLIRQSDNL